MEHPDWDRLIPELKEWNNGGGIDPESWVGCEGNFRLAAAYSLIFWPQFSELDGMVFRGKMDRETLESWMENCSDDRRCVEATANHIHLADLHHVGCPDASIERVLFLGKVLAEIYRMKLAAEFPNRRIVVELFEPPDEDIRNYQLTFYQQHDSYSVQPDAPARGSCLANVCGGAPVNLIVRAQSREPIGGRSIQQLA